MHKKYLFILMLITSAVCIKATAQDVPDQSQLYYNAGMSARTLQGYNIWQSFTAGLSGTLTKIEMGFFTSINGEGILNIYSGEGISGTLLQTQKVAVSCGGGNCLLPFSVDVPVSAGNLYSFQFIPGKNMPDPYGIQLADPGRYSRGVFGLVDPSGIYILNYDMVFQTYVNGAVLPVELLSLKE